MKNCDNISNGTKNIQSYYYCLIILFLTSSVLIKIHFLKELIEDVK
jgi:hypothetical protein